MGYKGRRQFSPEFKLEAIRAAERGDKPVTQVARELGIAAALLHTWMRQKRRSKKEAPTTGRLEKSEAEVRRLQRELDRVSEERDILKKAAAFFAKESR